MSKAAIDDQSRPVLARGVRLAKDTRSGEPILLFPEGVIYLSATAHEIVCHCDGKTTIDAIIPLLAENYEVERETLRKDVLECLNDLYQRKVLLFL
jgi:coenzyme PQQ biosynthesis protein PqqD